MTDPALALQKRVENYIKRANMTPTAFGKAALKNPSLVSRIRAGNISLSTIRKVHAYLEKVQK